MQEQYDDGGFSGGSLDRPALNRLLEDIKRGKIDCVVVYKVDRLSRSLMDFSRIMETFDKYGVSFVSGIGRGYASIVNCMTRYHLRKLPPKTLLIGREDRGSSVEQLCRPQDGAARPAACVSTTHWCPPVVGYRTGCMAECADILESILLLCWGWNWAGSTPDSKRRSDERSVFRCR